MTADEDADPKRVAIADRIQALEDRLAGIGDRVAALESRRQFVAQLAEALPDGYSEALSHPFSGADGWAAASTLIGDDLAKIGDATRLLHIEERTVNKDLAKAREDLDKLPPPRDHMEVRIAVATTAPATATLTVGYRTPSARWVPAYDALLATDDLGGKPKITLVRRAEVTQATGDRR